MWDYVLDDFLELACPLTEEERDLLLGELRTSKIRAESIDVHATFSVDGRLVIVLDGMRAYECWLYYPKAGKIEKYPLKGK